LASFDWGAINRMTIIAATKSRSADRREASTKSGPIRRNDPSTATT
jgi:hypothetical protein